MLEVIGYACSLAWWLAPGATDAAACKRQCATLSGEARGASQPLYLRTSHTLDPEQY